jgi:5-formyltetrahydrofolate cyclo-ligase
MTKAELRKAFLTKRTLLSEGECLAFSHRLCENFFAHIDLSFIRVVHIYLPIEKNNEPDTRLIIDRIRREFRHIQLAIPRVTKNGELENFFFEGFHQLKKNSWGIPEPQDGKPVESSEVDLVIVPLLAADSNGNRVGYGKGFYDKFLAQCKPSCKRIGLSFFRPVDAVDDLHPFDVPLTHLVVPEEVIVFAT